MAAKTKISRSLFPYALKSLFLNSNNYLIGLDPNGSELTESSTKAEWVSRELTTTGYARVPFGWESNQFGGFDSIDNRHETDTIRINFTAGGSILEYSQLAAIIGGSPDAPKSIPIENVNTTTDTITLESHGLVNGEELVLVPEGLNLPAPLATNTIYYAMQVTASAFAVSSDGVNIINLTNLGDSSIIWLKKAKGEKAFLINEYTSTSVLGLITLLPGQTQGYDIFLAAKDNGQ